MTLRVLAFVPTLGVMSETFIADALAGLVRAGAEVTVATGAVADRARAAATGATIRTAPLLHLHRPLDRIAARVRPGPAWSGRRDTRLDRSAAEVVARLVAELAPDVAYLDFGGTLARLAAPLAAAGVPFAAHLHGHDVTAALADAGYRDALAAAFSEASAVVVASDHVRRLAVLAGAAPGRVSVVRYGIDLEGTEPVPWPERRVPSVAFLGRLVAKKHPVALVEAFALVAGARPDARLHVIGDGPERARAEARAAARGIAHAVTFHGALPRARALALVRTAWVYAQHSVTSFAGDQEGFGIAIAEAAALGLPVVATLHNGIPEQVAHGETGLLVPEHDFEAMAAAILELLADPALCERLGAAGLARVRAGYAPEARAARLLAVLQRAAGGVTT